MGTARIVAARRPRIDALATHMPGKAVVVRYEDMSHDLGGELRRNCKRLGIDASPRAIQHCVTESTFERMSGGRQRGQDAPGQHVRKGVVGDWLSCFTAEDAAAFDRIAGRCLIEQGYEPDSGWTSRVRPQLQLAG